MNTQMKPTKAFRLADIISLIVGIGAFGIGLFNATMALNEKGYYLAVLLFGLFSVVSLQKTIRDKTEGMATSHIYYVLCWISTGSAIGLLVVGLYNAELLLSEKGFYGIAFLLSMFTAVTVQKNVRDTLLLKDEPSEINRTSDDTVTR